ncbi:hypothetical protein KAR91_70550 [Candidatus Pacearchaeota archaeon]|nr:hypothetical protein [Candidatus Pacearchaeota archaeon]
MIPTKEENPKGLHAKYYIQKIVGIKRVGDNLLYFPDFEFELKEVDDGSEYFVMRLDDGGSDPIHIQACRNAVLHYAEEIKDHLPELSKDLIERYGKTIES